MRLRTAIQIAVVLTVSAAIAFALASGGQPRTESVAHLTRHWAKTLAADQKLSQAAIKAMQGVSLNSGFGLPVPRSHAMAVAQCRRTAGRKARLGGPIIYRRGSFIAVLLFNKRDGSGFFCSWSPSESFSGPYAVGSSTLPGRLGIQEPQGAVTCGAEGYGLVGSDVTGVTFRFAHEPSIRAAVARGFYIFSWPYRSRPDEVVLKTTFGTTLIRHLSDAGGC